MDEDRRPAPPMAAPPERMAEAFLDFLRATILWKVEGLSEADLRRSVVPSGWTLLGMVKHLALVERWWFRIVFAGEDLPIPWSEADPDADWRVEPHETTEAILALYAAETDRAREIAAGAAWDDVAKRPGRDQTLGWVLTHMVEETARHCGHADVARELIDGRTGQ